MRCRPIVPAAMVRLKLLFVIGTLALIVGGAYGAIQALENPSPAVVSCADFATKETNKVWVRLTNCEIDFAGIYDRESRDNKEVSEFFVPLRPTGSKEPAKIVLSVKDTDLQQQASGAQPADEKARLAGGIHVIIGLLKKVDLKNGVTGMVQGPIEMKLLWKALSEKKIQPDAILVTLNDRPELGKSLMMLTGGLALIFVGLSLRRLKSQTPTSAPQPAAAAAAPRPAR
jgi:hypothetical protein